MVYYDIARRNNAATLLYYKAICNASENGYLLVEFGITNTPTLASWKEQFVPIKLPMKIYEIRYSNVRTIFEKAPPLLKWAWTHKRYIWDNKHRLIKNIIIKKKLY